MSEHACNIEAIETGKQKCAPSLSSLHQVGEGHGEIKEKHRGMYKNKSKCKGIWGPFILLWCDY